MKLPALVSVFVIAVVASSILTGQDPALKNPALLKAKFGKLPIYIIENQGVYPDEVKFYVQGKDKTLFFTNDGITFRLKGKGKSWVVKLEFVGANPDVVPQGEDKQKVIFSYFFGEEKDWKTGLPTFAKVVYEGLWPGIDLVYKGNVNQLKYEFVVKPGVDPGQIRLRYRGTTSVALRMDGALKVETPEGGFEDAPPIAWQDIDGKRVPVEMAFVLTDKACTDGSEFGFRISDYDTTKSLILDPAVLIYCGYIGGAGSDCATGIAVDASGSAYVAGFTNSTEITFPVKVGPDLKANGGTIDNSDGFVAKVNPQGTALVYCGYIGGSSDDYCRGIAVDGSGNVYLTGNTESTELTFPVKVGPDTTYNGGSRYGGDAFVAKVNSSGTALVFCGYIGGSGNECGNAIALDPNGHAYLTGRTDSSQATFPVKVGPDLTFNRLQDAFVAKVNPQGTSLVYCGYIGGMAGRDDGLGIAVDSTGAAYVCGGTDNSQTSFPVVVGPDLTFNGGWHDAFIAKVHPQGMGLVYCGYIGGSGGSNWSEDACGIAVDSAGNALVTGYTDSTDASFPVIGGPDLTFNGGVDAFIAKVNASGTALTYCGYIGGTGWDEGYGVAVDARDNVYVTGRTSSTEASFPVTVGPDTIHNGGYNDAFVVRVNTMGSGLDYCGYVGGSSGEGGLCIAMDQSGNAYVAGATGSDEKSFPVQAGPDVNFNGWQNPIPGIGGGDAFVAKVPQSCVEGSGTARPGGTVSLSILATGSLGLPYQLGSSLGAGPIPFDNRKLGLSTDAILVVSVNDLWPSVFSSYRGVIDRKGQAKAAINIPNIVALIGVRLHTAFVTLDPSAPSGIKSISNTFSFSVTK